MASAGEIFKYTIFGGVVAFCVFVAMQFWSYYDLHVSLWAWVKSWSRTSKINATWALGLFLIGGTWYTWRNLRKNIQNLTFYDR